MHVMNSSAPSSGHLDDFDSASGSLLERALFNHRVLVLLLCLAVLPLLNACTAPPEGVTVKGLKVKSFPATESLIFDYQSAYGRDPDANALYHFTLGGLRFLHMGDIGTAIPQGHIDALKGQVDVLLALTGEHATIALDDLDDAIAQIGPRAVIPMHYFSPKGVLKIEPVETFLNRLPANRITRVGKTSMDLTAEMLPAIGQPPHIWVLEQSR